MCNVSTLLKPILFAVYTNLFYSGKDITINELYSVVSIKLETSKANFIVFTNKSCDDTYSVCMNGINLSRVFVTTLLGVNMDSKLDWNDHIMVIVTKPASSHCVFYRK